MSFGDHKPIETLAMVILESLDGTSTVEQPATVEYNAVHGNYYALLGLERGSTREEILDAVESLRAKCSMLSAQAVAALDNAETILLDPSLRARYDATLD